jgi:hypothetical protein
MALAQTKSKIDKDRFSPDGVRLFNPSKPHGVVYADGYSETKYLQEHEGRDVQYRGDGFPVGYEPGKPLPQPVDVVEAENVALKQQVAALTASNAQTQDLLKQIQAQLAAKPAAAGDAPEGAGRAGAAKPK